MKCAMLQMNYKNFGYIYSLTITLRLLHLLHKQNLRQCRALCVCLVPVQFGVILPKGAKHRMASKEIHLPPTLSVTYRTAICK